MTRLKISSAKLRTVVLAGSAIALGFAATGCASHKFVRENVAVVDARVDATDQRVAQVEGTAGEALQRATAAHKLAEGKAAPFVYHGPAVYRSHQGSAPMSVIFDVETPAGCPPAQA